MEDARNSSAKMLDEYMPLWNRHLRNTRKKRNGEPRCRCNCETEKIERETNKKLSIEQINIKRAEPHKQDELKDKLFVELKDMLENYMDTPGLSELLGSR